MEPAKFYHIYNHANGHENLFCSDENNRYFLQQWAKHINPVADPYAYCLMPNHFHFLVKVKSESSVRKEFKIESSSSNRTFGKFTTFQKLVSKQFSNFFSSYTQAFNKMNNRKGSLFVPNFKRKKINSDSYLTNVIFYIHHNPIHHGFVKDLADWPHSSFHSLTSEKQTSLRRQSVLEWFGNREQFNAYHAQPFQNLNRLELKFTRNSILHLATFYNKK